MTPANLTNARLALYLNQAEHNALMIIKEIVRKINPDEISTFKDETNLAEHFYKFCTGYYDKQLELQRIAELLEFYFPFAAILAKDADLVKDVANAEKAQVEKLTLMLVVLNAFRNHYSHYTEHDSILHDGYLKKDLMQKTNDSGKTRTVFPGLTLFDKEGKDKHFTGRNILIAVRKTANAVYKKAVLEKIEQEYFKHSEKNRSTSKRDYKYIDMLKGIDPAFAPLLTIKRNERNNTEDKFVPVSSQLFRDKREERKDDKGQVIRNKKTGRAEFNVRIEAINPDGLLYFICLFLNSGDANMLMSSTTGFKRSDGLVWESKRMVFRHFSCKPPQSRLRPVAMTNESLLLDIIGELQKCPAEIYPLLDEDHRAKFRFGTDSYINENDEKVENESLQKRYENRFPYLALRYLDSLNLPGLRFQLTLGKVNMKQYEKQFMGENIDRQLQKEVKVFDRLTSYPYENDVDDDGTVTRQAVSKLIEDCVKQPDADKNSLLLKEWEDEGILLNNWQHFAPHYNLENNNIALSLAPLTFSELCCQKQANKFGLPHLKKPDAILSVYELPALLWLQMKKKEPEAVTNFIKKTIDDYKEEFNAGIEKKGRNNPEPYRHDYPKPIYAILTNKRAKPYDKAKGIAELVLAENEESRRQADKWLEIARNKAAQSKRSKGKLNPHTIIPKGKRGTVATWLAKDIIWLCVPGARQHIGQAMANALQENLAIYSPEKLRELFNYKAGGAAQSIMEGHPFISKRTLPDNLFDYYAEYLSNRAVFFIEQVNAAFKGINKTRFPDLFGISADVKSLESYLKPFKTSDNASLTVNLAKGMFNEEIIACFQNNSGTSNNSNLVQAPFSFNFTLQGLMPELQEYYRYPRIYKRFDEDGLAEQLVFTDIGAAKNSASAELFRKINDNEKQLRQRQTEDRILFLIAGKLSRKLFGQDIFAENTLSDFFNGNIWDKRREFKFTVHPDLPQVGAEVFLKDAGVFTKFLADKRLKPLLAYYNTAAVDYLYQLPPGEAAKAEREKNKEYYFDRNYKPNLKDELRFFEEAREALFADALAFERDVLDWADNNNRLAEFNTFYNRKGYSNHAQDFLSPIAAILVPGFQKGDLKKPGDLKKTDDVLLMLSIMSQVRNSVSHNQFFENSWKQRFEGQILNTSAAKQAFIAFGEKELENYYSVTEKNLNSINLPEETKAKRALEAEQRAKISARFFKEFCNGTQTAFIAEWWYVAYRYMLNSVMQELNNQPVVANNQP